MAKGAKKKETLTPEEKLQQALVPVEEQPYPVPENWCWTRCGEVFDFVNGYAFKSEKFTSDNGVTVIRISDISNNEIVVDNAVKTLELVNDDFVIHYGDLLIAMSGATTGKNGIYHLHEKAYLNQRVGNIRIKNHNTVLNEYRNFYILSQTEEILRSAYGGAQPNISSRKMYMMLFPLPPLPEQQRIVARIESLFAKLDEVKEKAQAVVDGYEDRKAAILHKAFTGELTAKWREEKGITKETWSTQVLGKLADSQYGYTEKSSVKPIGPKFLRITDIQDGDVIWTDVPYCKIDTDNKVKYALNIGDIVIARTGATTGKSYMIENDIDAVFASYLIRVNINKKDLLRSRYLYYFLQCPSYWQQITELSSGIAQPGVNASKLKSLVLPLPSVKEQEKIEKILKKILQIGDEVKSAAQSVLDQIDTMKKSILARAFRGQLGTNDPTDEPAVELLKKVL